ncbi:MAG TPA: tRNA (adenosine(37)-N6)-dimethylallyltransferase MiaA [Lactovum miscens]|uniref:tRNA (adenosine(37)-N6)-dimethylallyltransferase MiaA n=1 Tax=Lactovum miscens TaxID=190387 RepID=UPI002ED9AAF6
MMKKKVLVVVGPTAIGKSALAVKLAHEFKGEIISGDSQQIYRSLNIGTGKVTIDEMDGIPHHLIDIRNLDESFSAHDFVLSAMSAIEDILSRENLPIIVGGTGLYIQALTEGYHLGGEKNHESMMKLRQRLKFYSDNELKLALNPENQIQQFNRRRAIRAIELQEFGKGENYEVPYDFGYIGLESERAILYDRINKRVDRMLEVGILDEAKKLFEGYQQVQASKAIGYKEFFPYFKGEISLEEAVEKLKQDSRRYAKRQLTWFKNRMDVKFFDVFELDFLENVIMWISEFLRNREED